MTILRVVFFTPYDCHAILYMCCLVLHWINICSADQFCRISALLALRFSLCCKGGDMIRFAVFRRVRSLSLICLFLLSACGTAVTIPQSQQTVVIQPGFQTQTSPAPTVPPYRCGAWSANNLPGAYSTLTIYARLTHNLAGAAGTDAKAIVHFQGGDLLLPQRPLSDEKGYVTFTLPLLGRQPRMEPATVDVVFTVAETSVQCTAFFTPQ
jgi:hypothetical protein